MEPKFELGSWVIDTQKDIVPTIICVFPEIIPMTEQLYVLKNDETSEVYVQSEENMIPYDKYYFDGKNSG